MALNRATFELFTLKAIVKSVYFIAGHTVAMVTIDVTKMITMHLSIIGQVFDTMVVASTDKEWL